MKSKRFTAFVGSYEEGSTTGGGGIYTVVIEPEGESMKIAHHHSQPKQAGYLIYNEENRSLYAVDEQKTTGRNAVQNCASVLSFTVDENGRLEKSGQLPAPGPRPTYLDANFRANTLFCANHGDFQHVERVNRADDGSWHVEYVYDDSTAIAYELDSNGVLGHIKDVTVFRGQGKDPNFSPQNGGHAQASAHAHCIVLCPNAKFIFVCDKGTDRIHVFRFDGTFELLSTYQLPAECGPRHLAYHDASDQLFVTCEFASELAVFKFNPQTAEMTLTERLSTVTANYHGVNEPAHVCLHPTLPVVYVNNRGEDSLVWFSFSQSGQLRRAGSVSLSKSIHPGLAARSFCFSPCGEYFLIADRSANLLRMYQVDSTDGRLSWFTELSIPDPAFVCAHII